VVHAIGLSTTDQVSGSGSMSFELLSRRSPGRMSRTLQPVAGQDVVHLHSAALRGEPRNRHHEVGAPQQVCHPEVLRLLASTARLELCLSAPAGVETDGGAEDRSAPGW
jgi:hypothetical protein